MGEGLAKVLERGDISGPRRVLSRTDAGEKIGVAENLERLFQAFEILDREKHGGRLSVPRDDHALVL